MKRRRAWRTAVRLAAAAAAVSAVVCGAALFASWLLIDPPLAKASEYPESLVLRNREGGVMRVKLGKGDVDCRPRRLSDGGEWIAKAIIASEDKRFREHCGADFRALARAIGQNAFYGRRISGASTITEQVARLIEPHPRRLFWKWVEFVQALKIERARSKDWILAQYLDRAPFGGVYVGIEAAAHGWFDKSPGALSLGEAALLAGIVQAPTRFRPDIHMDRALKRRDYVLSRMEALGLATPAQVAAARAAAPRLKRGRHPFLAPHYCDWALRALVPENGGRDITTPLDPAVQEIAEDAVRRKAGESGADCSAVVVDAATGDVVAMACSGDYFGDPAGQVNGALTRRPAGSTLKPFFFVRALERGLLCPTEALPDSPVAFGAFIPANFGGGHRGSARADEALVDSLNLPFYEIVKRLGVRDAFATLEKYGLAPPGDPAGKYGLGMAVGNVEVSLLALAGAYAKLAAAASTNAAAWIAADILSGEERSFAAFGHVADAALPRAAWKTGTSAAFRDAWTVLWTPREVVAVRCGHRAWRFGDRSLVGAAVAAPLAWDIFRALHPGAEAPWYGEKPRDLVAREVCAETGLPPSPRCVETRTAWAIEGRTPARPCRARHDAAAVAGGAGAPAAAAAPKILRPAAGAVLRLPGEAPWSVAVEIAGVKAGETLWWTLDGVPCGAQDSEKPFFAPVRSPGTHTVGFSTAEGETAAVEFSVTSPSERPKRPM